MAPDYFVPWPEPARSGLDRGLRLIMAIGTVAAGLCLVLGFVAFMASNHGRPRAGPVLTTRADSKEHHGGSPSGNGADLIAGRIVRSYQGAGTRPARRFVVNQPGIWGLAWAFNCADNQHGTFMLMAGNDSSPGQHVDAPGQSGHGLIWNTATGDLQVTVVSGCSWSIRIVLPRRPARQSDATATPRPDPSAHPSPEDGQHTPADNGHGPSHHPKPSASPNPHRSSQHPGQGAVSRISVV